MSTYAAPLRDMQFVMKELVGLADISAMPACAEVTGDLADETRKLKQTSDEGVVILGSGSIVAQLAPHRLIDAYQIVIKPVVLGQGRTMFEGVQNRLNFERTDVRLFKNGNVVISYGVGANA